MDEQENEDKMGAVLSGGGEEKVLYKIELGRTGGKEAEGTLSALKVREETSTGRDKAGGTERAHGGGCEDWDENTKLHHTSWPILDLPSIPSSLAYSPVLRTMERPGGEHETITVPVASRLYVFPGGIQIPRCSPPANNPGRRMPLRIGSVVGALGAVG